MGTMCLSPAIRNRRRIQTFAGAASVVRSHAGSGQPSLPPPPPPPPARGSEHFVHGRDRQRHVPPFPRDPAGTDEHPPTDHEQVVMELTWVQRAISLVREYFLPHYYCASDLISQPPLANKGLHILAHFGKRDSFTLGEAANFIHARTPDVRPVLEWLERVGAVRLKTKGRTLEVCPIASVDY